MIPSFYRRAMLAMFLFFACWTVAVVATGGRARRTDILLILLGLADFVVIYFWLWHKAWGEEA